MDFKVIAELLIIHSAFVKYLRKMGIKQSSASALYRLPITFMIQLGRRSCIILSLSMVSP